ncbi:MAG TPA: glycosyltransferase family 2 protein, partial [Acidimicrobiia bacterium]
PSAVPLRIMGTDSGAESQRRASGAAPARALAIIPAWNEEAALPGTLAELHAMRPDLDVLVVSDGSTDHTADIARAAGATVAELAFNLGIGGALQTGFRYAVRHGYERAVQFDADGQHDPREIATLFHALDAGADMVVGTRFGDGGTVEYRVGPMRRGAMSVLRFMMNTMTHNNFSDTSSGFRAFDRPVLEMFSNTYPVEFMDSTESLLHVCNAGMRAIEVPTVIRERQAGTPSTRHFRLVFHYTRLLVTMLSQWTFRRPADAGS